MQIAVGSSNPVKFNAVWAVFAPLYPDPDIFSVEVPSDVAPQPWGNAETRRGAYNRARSALDLSGADFGVGLEGGVQETESGLMTCAWAVIVGADGQTGVGGNSSILLPAPVAEKVRAGIELGAAMDALVQVSDTRRKNGAIGILTNDLETRESAYAHILRLALAPFQHPDWYPVSTASDSHNP